MADRAVAPFLKYPGGKRRLARRIIDLMPPHTCYVEPFGGMAAVLLAKQESKVEVWNDIDQGLANAMRIVKYHPDELARELQFMLAHRAERKHWLAHPGETDIQRATRWIALRWSGFAGRPGSGFHISKISAIVSRETIIETARAVSRRLARVHVECLPWERVFDIYDAPGTLFFCDPPYFDGDQKMYEFAFTEADHRRLRDRLRTARGRWIVTYGDHPLIRELYKDCHIEPATRVRTFNQRSRKLYTELIIRP